MKIVTEHPVAIHSADHINPKGAVNDNTHCLSFVKQIEQIITGLINYLDLGCAGGGLVADFLSRGHCAYGVEGSNKPQKLGLGEWKNISANLFTADLSKPMHFTASGALFKFDLITAWEVLEHFSETDINQLISNIHGNLKPGGYFIASVASFPDPPYHITIQPRSWWLKKFKAFGFSETNLQLSVFPRRGSFYLILKNNSNELQ